VTTFSVQLKLKEPPLPINSAWIDCCYSVYVLCRLLAQSRNVPFECPAVHNLRIKHLGPDFLDKQVLINNPRTSRGSCWRSTTLCDTAGLILARRRRRRNGQEIDAAPDLRGCSTVEELWRGGKLYGLLLQPQIVTWRRSTGRFTTYRFHNVMHCCHLSSSDARLITMCGSGQFLSAVPLTDSWLLIKINAALASIRCNKAYALHLS